MDRYNDQASGRALIEIRLCNERATPMPIPIGLWMFQTKLHVNAGGADVFLPVCDVLEQDLAERDEEVRQLNLQYRNRLEYAIGRTCSAAWSVNGSRRPSAVWTTWLPVAETPHTRARVGGERAVVHGQSRRGYVADWRRSSRDMEAGFRVRRLSRPSCPSTCTRPPTRGWLMLRPKRKRCAASSS